MIASKDVKGTYDGLVIPRKLPGPNGLVDAAPIYKAAMAQARPALLKHFLDTLHQDRRAGRADHAGASPSSRARTRAACRRSCSSSATPTRAATRASPG